MVPGMTATEVIQVINSMTWNFYNLV